MTNPHRRRVLVSLLSGAVACMSAVAVHAQPSVDELRRLVEQGDADAQYALGGVYGDREGPIARDMIEAVRLFRLAAEQGHLLAQMALAAIYLVGEGVPQTPAEAERWFRRAAEQGDAQAQQNLGQIYQGLPEPYRTDHDIPVDHAEAVRWFERSAEQGHVWAAKNLAAKYRDGHGIPQDHAAAFRWFLHAAELGDVEAQGEVGTLYAFGQGVPQDDVAAYMWLDLATLQASGENLQVLLIDREEVADRLSAGQFAEAQRRVQAWTPTPAR